METWTSTLRKVLADSPLLWASRISTLALGSHAEVTVAQSLQFGIWAYALPVAIDSYAVGAFALRKSGGALLVLAVTYGGGIGFLSWQQATGQRANAAAGVGALVGLLLVIVLWHGERLQGDERETRTVRTDRIAELERQLAAARAATDQVRRERADLLQQHERNVADAHADGFALGQVSALADAKLPHIGTETSIELTEGDRELLPLATEVARMLRERERTVTRDALLAGMRERGATLGTARAGRLLKAVAA